MHIGVKITILFGSSSFLVFYSSDVDRVKMSYSGWKIESMILQLMFLISIMSISVTGDFTSVCPNECKCKWVSGSKKAECTNAHLKSIPHTLSSDIQFLDLSNNSISSIVGDAFTQANLDNLHKIHMKYCGIKDIHKDAFRGLRILFEIDLRGNFILNLHPSTFKDNEKLRILILSRNRIQKLEDGIFSNHTHLQNVELSDNLISQIGSKTFGNVPSLNILKLDGNLLSSVKLSIFQPLELQSLDIHNNTWRCDCHMREFRDWFMSKNYYTQPIACVEPLRLEDKLWSNLKSEDFACKPEILWPHEGSVVRVSDDKVTLSCLISGDPKPDVYWYYNNLLVTNNTFRGEGRYITHEEQSSKRWYNLTITKLRGYDQGEFRCTANSSGGIDERNITLLVTMGILGGKTPVGDMWLVISCLLFGIVCAVIIVFLILLFCYRRRSDLIHKKPPNNIICSNGSVMHHIVVEPDQQKTLLTTVNPVQKPPRKYDSSQSELQTTELTELNRNLLADSSTHGSTAGGSDSADDRRTPDFDEKTQYSRSQENIYQDNKFNHHPPDLLAFSGRAVQSSPAGSSISNDVENYRPHRGHSPMHSPVYQPHMYNTSLYSTLPYDRSQSPFISSSVKTPVSQKSGYVTIPRRPRVPSWASAPTPTPSLLDESTFKIEPVYDNLGPRTTADGSSVLSLTKRVAAEAAVKTRPLPPTPNYSQTLPNKSKLTMKHPMIQENDLQGTLPSNRANSKGVIRPLPFNETRNSSLNFDKRRSSWANRSMPETMILKRASSNDVLRPKENSLNSPYRPKVPPRPPPTPRNNAPLFEDEGEDGTEV